MSVERNKDGSVTIKDKNGVTVIGKIVEVTVKKREEKYSQWVEDCAKLVTACDHTVKETEMYFLEQCDALPLDSNDRRMKSFHINVIMNHCKDKLKHQPAEFSFDMTDAEIEKWHKEERTVREEVMNASPEEFGLNMRGYYLSHAQMNQVYYEEAYLEIQKSIKDNQQVSRQIEMSDICFFFEETTGQCQCSSGGTSLMNQLIVFRGVSQDDIEKHSPRFLGYITTLREMGELPG